MPNFWHNNLINPICPSLIEHIQEPGGGGPKYLGFGWGSGSNSFWKWLVVDWCAIFKRIHEVWILRTLKNNAWLLKLLVGWRPVWSSLLGSPFMKLHNTYLQKCVRQKRNGSHMDPSCYIPLLKIITDILNVDVTIPTKYMKSITKTSMVSKK